MADLQQSAEALLEKARLDIVVLETEGIDSSSLAQQISNSGIEEYLAKQTQRQSLYLDENLNAYSVLCCPFAEGEVVDALLSRVETTIESIAVGTSRHQADEKGQQPAPLKDSVETQQVKRDTEPVVVVRKPDSSNEGSICIIWPFSTHISRSRIRSNNPSLYFAATLKFHVEAEQSTADPEDEFMEPFVPESINLLESLKLSPNLRKNPPVLTAARLAKVLPQREASQSSVKVLRNGASRHLIRLIPAINTRARFTRVGASPSQTKMLAAVDVDIAPWITDSVDLKSIEITLSDGRAETLTGHAIRLPQTRKPRDALILAYNLLPNHTHSSSAPTSTVHTLSLTLSASIANRPLKISWRTPVDLAPLHVKPAIFAPFPSAQPASRPTTASSQPRSSTDFNTPKYANHALTLTVTGPPGGRVPVNETLRWSILLANRSTRTLHLALIPITSLSSLPAETISRAQHAAAESRKQHRHRPTLSTSLFRPVSEAVLASGTEASDADIGLIPLTADLRVGPVPPGQCATAEMRFLVLKEGAVKVQAVRVVDLEGEIEGPSWTEGAGVEGGSKRARSWVDVGSGFLPDIIGTAALEE